MFDIQLEKPIRIDPKGNFYFINFIDEIITESNNISSIVNTNNFQPTGLFFSDTVHYPTYPITEIVNDTYKVEFYNYKNLLVKKYNLENSFYLPFHFLIEYIEYGWNIFLTRPLTAPPQLPKNKKNNPLSNKIHILLMGDYKNQVFDLNLRIIIKNLIDSLFLMIRKINSNSTINKTNFLYVIPEIKNIFSFIIPSGYKINILSN